MTSIAHNIIIIMISCLVTVKTVFLQIHAKSFCILALEGPREKNDTSNCSQWPHLYTTYEATYGLK